MRNGIKIHGWIPLLKKIKYINGLEIDPGKPRYRYESKKSNRSSKVRSVVE